MKCDLCGKKDCRLNADILSIGDKKITVCDECLKNKLESVLWKRVA